MGSPRRLLILFAVLAAVAVVIWLAVRERPDGAEPPVVEAVEFDFTEVPVHSPDLEVGPAEVRGALHETNATWRVSIPCAEPDGCAGSFAVELRYDGGGGEGRVVLLNRADVPTGGELRFSGLQNAPTPVERISRLTLEVRSRDRTGSEVEIPL